MSANRSASADTVAVAVDGSAAAARPAAITARRLQRCRSDHRSDARKPGLRALPSMYSMLPLSLTSRTPMSLRWPMARKGRLRRPAAGAVMARKLFDLPIGKQARPHRTFSTGIPAPGPYLPFMQFQPALPTRGTKVPAGPEWLHEIKYDGFRLMVHRDGDRVRLLTRNGHDWSGRYPWIVESALKNRTKQRCFVCTDHRLRNNDGRLHKSDGTR
jgi:ATP dependent DNA ligase domain